MKKLLAALAVVMVIMSGAAWAQGDCQLYVDGVLQTDAEPIIREDRTFVPVRKIAEMFGYEVDYIGATKEIPIKNAEKDLLMQVGSTKFTDNGTVKEMDVKPFIHEDRTFVPLRFISEVFGKPIEWDGANRAVYVGKKPDMTMPKGTTHLDFSQYGFTMDVKPEFLDHITYKEDPARNGVIFYDKFIYEKDHGGGELAFVNVQNSQDFSPYEYMGYGLYYGDSKVLVDSYPTGITYTPKDAYHKSFDKANEIFYRAIINPSTTVFPESAGAKAILDGNGNYVYTFGAPQVEVKISQSDLEGVLLTTSPTGITFYDRSNYAEYGGMLTGVYEFDEPTDHYAVLASKGGKSIELAHASDVQYNMENPYARDTYNQAHDRVRDNLKVTVK